MIAAHERQASVKEAASAEIANTDIGAFNVRQPCGRQVDLRRGIRAIFVASGAGEPDTAGLRKPPAWPCERALRAAARKLSLSPISADSGTPQDGASGGATRGRKFSLTMPGLAEKKSAPQRRLMIAFLAIKVINAALTIAQNDPGLRRTPWRPFLAPEET